MDQEEIDALVHEGFRRYIEFSGHCDALEADIDIMAKKVLGRTPGQHFINPRSDLLWFTAKHLLWRLYCVGSSGILYERSGSRVIDLPGVMGLPVCMWAIRKGLNTDDWSGTLVLESFSEWEPTVRLLRRAVGKGPSANLDRPPIQMPFMVGAVADLWKLKELKRAEDSGLLRVSFLPVESAKSGNP